MGGPGAGEQTKENNKMLKDNNNKNTSNTKFNLKPWSIFLKWGLAVLLFMSK